MARTPTGIESFDLETVIAGFEEKWKNAGEATIADFLPDPASPEYATVLEELVRTDIEIRWANGKPRDLDAYLAEFPGTLKKPSVLRNIAFEEFRVKSQHGEIVAPNEYATKYSIDVDAWMSYHPDIPSSNDENPPATNPKIGETICGFQVLDRLGSGASGSVFIAKQKSLSGRLVAIKVSPRTSEPEILAQLQHTNIVPIFSVSREQDQQVFCMPLLGVVTLSEVLDQNRQGNGLSIRPQQLITTVAAKRAPTLARNLTTVDVPSKADAEDSPIAPGVHLRPKLNAMTGENSLATWIWFFSKIAEGLVHAHEHEIVHRDLKPENILIADNGQPLILDFHLSTSHDGRGSTYVGGTLPYMSPEQLRSLNSGQSVDARSDVYSFGVMLFQTIVGQLPFPYKVGESGLVVEQMIEARRVCNPDFQKLADHSPALSSIVQRCLEFDPSDRYQDSRSLSEDLNRWLDHRPLKHAANISLRERSKNWMIRHPRLSSATSIGILSLILLSVAAFGFWQRGKRIAHLDALEQCRSFVAEIEDHIPRLATPAQDYQASRQLLLDAIETLEDWGATSEASLRQSQMFFNLDAEHRESALTTARHLGYWIADSAHRLNARTQTTSDNTDLAEKVDWPLSNFAAPSGDSFLNRFLQAAQYQSTGEFEKALAIMEPLSQNHSDRPYVWLLKGNILQSMNRMPEAEACFGVCVGLLPNPDWAFAQRGLSRYLQKKYDLAIQDFGDAIDIDDSFAHYYLNRGLCFMANGNAVEADSDFSRAIALGASETRVYFLRSRVRNALGNRNGAIEDYQTGLRLEPSDELSWIARGIAKIERTPEEALKDFEEALVANPNSKTALQNIAHVYAERLGDSASAAKSMQKLVEKFPNDAEAHASLGVMLARQGDTTAALESAGGALKLADDSQTQYVVAGIYALLSGDNPSHAKRALALLRQASKSSPGMVAEQMAHDPDLKLLENLDEFVQFREDLNSLLAR